MVRVVNWWVGGVYLFGGISVCLFVSGGLVWKLEYIVGGDFFGGICGGWCGCRVVSDGFC